MKKIIKGVTTALIVCAITIGVSKVVASAATKSYYSLTPSGMGSKRMSASIKKSTTSSGKNKNSKVQGSGSLFSYLIFTTNNERITYKYTLTSGTNITMDYYHASWYVGHPVQLVVQSKQFDVYGRNAYGYWSPDNF